MFGRRKLGSDLVLVCFDALASIFSFHSAPRRRLSSFLFLPPVCLATVDKPILSKNYSSAVLSPQPSWRGGTLTKLLILLPLLIYYLCSSIGGISAALALPGFGPEGNKMLDSLHDEVWGRLAYGPTLAGVLCVSVMAFTGPILEELVFRGFLINALAKRNGFVVAVIAASACFALTHVLQFGVGMHLIPLFFSAITYAMIRIYSGSLTLAIFSHLAINVIVFFPKWVITVLHFAHH